MGIILTNFESPFQIYSIEKDKDHFWDIVIAMNISEKFLSKIRHKSFLIGILYLIGLLSLYNDADPSKRGRPYVYPTTVIL
jgi:hypothetical protein